MTSLTLINLKILAFIFLVILMMLFFLFQKPLLLQLIFDNYVQAPKSVKQVCLIIAKFKLTIVVVMNTARLSVHIGQFSNSQMVRHLYLFYPRL